MEFAYANTFLGPKKDKVGHLRSLRVFPLQRRLDVPILNTAEKPHRRYKCT
jgi:hypothetical protein